MSSFVAHLAPPGPALKSYSPAHRSDAQPSSEDIPKTFLDAMAVREAVFVDEQHILLENEFDSEDAQSWHWVVYASVGGGDLRRGSGGIPVGTVRVVPPPHVHWDGPKMESDSGLRRNGEAYVRLGRLAVLKEFRKLGLSNLLMNAAMQYVAEHPDEVVPPVSGAKTELRRIETGQEDVGEWDGLVLVHAQKAIERLYTAWGFTRDEGMGEWDEEGIMHVGMWRRVQVNRRRQSVIS